MYVVHLRCCQWVLSALLTRRVCAVLQHLPHRRHAVPEGDPDQLCHAHRLPVLREAQAATEPGRPVLSLLSTREAGQPRTLLSAWLVVGHACKIYSQRRPKLNAACACQAAVSVLSHHLTRAVWWPATATLRRWAGVCHSVRLLHAGDGVRRVVQRSDPRSVA